jgi:hypothetical protein
MNLIMCTTTDDVYISIEPYCTERVKIIACIKNYAMRSLSDRVVVSQTAWNSAEDATCYHDSLPPVYLPQSSTNRQRIYCRADTAPQCKVGPKCALIERLLIPTQSGAGHKKPNRTENKTINKAKPTGYKTSGRRPVLAERFQPGTSEYMSKQNVR